MKLRLSLFLLIFQFQISAQDTLTFLRIDFDFEIKSSNSFNLFPKEKNDTKYRYHFNEIESTPLLTKNLVTNNNIYNLNLGFDEIIDANIFVDEEGYTLWEKPDYYDFTKWNLSTNTGYIRTQNIFRQLNERTAFVAHIFTRDNYLSSNFESQFNSSDKIVYFNCSYSNEIYSEDFTQPSSFYANRTHFNFHQNFAAQRFVNWSSIRFPISNNQFNNIARMNFNFVINENGYFFVKGESEYNIIFFKNSRLRFQNSNLGIGARPFNKTLIFILMNRTSSFSFSRVVRPDVQSFLTLNIRQGLSF